MDAWGSFDELGDEDLVYEIVSTAVPERRRRREALFEALRERMEPVIREAFRDRGLPERLEQDFVDWLWTWGRMSACFETFALEEAPPAFATYLHRAVYKWRCYDFLRWRKRRQSLDLGGVNEMKIVPRRPDDPAPDPDLLAWVRSVAEDLSDAERIALKLVHFRDFTLTDRDWEFIAGQRGALPRKQIEADLESYRRSPQAILELGQAGALIGKSLFAIGQAVKRARDKIDQRYRDARPGGAS
jgi:hypothetical protein